MTQLKFKDEEITIGSTNMNDEIKPKSIEPLNYLTFQPEGFTLPFYAIEKSFVTIAKRISGKIPTSAIIVFFLDGNEKAIRLFKLEKVKAIISNLQKNGKSTFSFI